jgi:tartrate/fumarate subfamily iron-sulfur-dependent hydro-lyase beta chain
MSGKIYHLTTPVTKEQAMALRVGDVVYLDGTVYTARDLAHERLFELADKGEKPGFDLNGGAVWHCGPVSRKKGENEWEVTSIGPTTSYRLTNETPRLLKEFGVRLIIGKGGMGFPTVRAMQEHGAAFLAATGGCASVYAENVKRVRNVYWADLGLAEAVWELEIAKLGALVVAIDSTGATLYEQIMKNAVSRLPQCYDNLGIKDPGYRVIHWPPTLAGTSDVPEGMAKVGGGE